MLSIVVTLLVLKGTAWLKAAALRNIPLIDVTLAVLKGTAWLKADAR